MKILTKLIVATTLVVALYWLLFGEVSTVSKTMDPAQQNGTFSDPQDIKKNRLNKQKNVVKTKKAIGLTEQQAAIIANAIEEPQDPSLDYITAYRDWQYFANCFTDVQDFHKDKDPLETLAERFALNPRESQNEPTPQQNFYYQRHVEICQSLIDDEGDEFEEIRSTLKKRFQSIKPETNEEKQLALALQMVQQLAVYEGEHSRSSYKKTTLSSDQLAQINTEIQRLTSEMMTVYNNTEELDPQQAEAIKAYSEQIDNLRLIVNDSEVLDTDLQEQGEAQVNAYLNSIDEYLHHVQSPDAFLLLSEVLFRSSFFRRGSPVVDLLKNYTGLHDDLYREVLNDVVLPLVACSMDYPCDAESDIMMSYCLGLKDSMFNQACGLSVEDFYFGFYIGSNQLSDVNTYFNFIVSRYAN